MRPFLRDTLLAITALGAMLLAFLIGFFLCMTLVVVNEGQHVRQAGKGCSVNVDEGHGCTVRFFCPEGVLNPVQKA